MEKVKEKLIYEIRRRPMIAIGLFLLFTAILRTAVWLYDPEPYEPAEGRQNLTGKVREIEVSDSGYMLLMETDSGRYRIRVPEDLSSTVPELHIGNSILVSGKLRDYERASNPGQFDADRYYRIQKIYGRMTAEHICLLNTHIIQPADVLCRLRIRLGNILDDICSRQSVYEEAGSVFHAILLGERSMLDDEVKELYRSSGIAHILAISGMHLSILGWGLYKFLRWLRIPIPAAGVISSMMLGAYVLMTGMSASATRAYLFFVLTILSEVRGRGRDLPTSCILSYAVMVTVDPLYLLDAGFHLSFAAVGALCLLEPLLHPMRMEERYPIPEYPTRSKFEVCLRVVRKRGAVWWRQIETTILLQLTMLPVMAYYYYETAPLGILLNLLVLPTVSIVLGSGIMAAAAACICGCAVGVSAAGAATVGTSIAGVCLLPGIWLLALYDRCCRLGQMLPGTVCILGKPAIWQMVVYVICLIIGITVYGHYRKGRRKAAAVIPILIGVMLLVIHPGQAEFRAGFLDVGQGDCICLYVRGAGTAIVDCGSSSVKGVGKYRLLPYLKSQGIRKIDCLFLTHTDEDHMNGVEEVINPLNTADISVHMLCMTQAALGEERGRVLAYAAMDMGIPVRTVSAGEELSLGGLTLTCLSPEQITEGSREPEADSNNQSLVFMASYGRVQLLLTGDLENEGEAGIIEKYCNSEERIHVLKAGHHGSSGSTGEAFLDWYKPDVTVISCGKNNRYGHPHPETLERLRRTGCRVLRTDEMGCIEIETDGKKMTIRSCL